MPSVINPRGGPFPVYPSASPPTVDVGIFTIAKTGVDLKTAATTNIFTVPAGRNFIGTLASFLVTSVTSGGAGTISTTRFQESSGSRTMIGGGSSASTTPVANQTTFVQTPGANALSSCSAGNIVQLVLAASESGSNAVTGTVYVTGFYSS